MSPPRIRLRPAEPEDAGLMVAFHRRPGQRRAGTHAAPESFAAVRKRIVAAIESDRAHTFLIELLDDDGKALAVGDCGLLSVQRRDRSASVFIGIPEAEHQDHGLGTAAMRELARIAFADLGLRRLELEVVGDNPRAVRCYEKVGYVREGVRRSSAFHDGAWVDSVCMALFREDAP